MWLSARIRLLPVDKYRMVVLMKKFVCYLLESEWIRIITFLWKGIISNQIIEIKCSVGFLMEKIYPSISVCRDSPCPLQNSTNDNQINCSSNNRFVPIKNCLHNDKHFKQIQIREVVYLQFDAISTINIAATHKPEIIDHVHSGPDFAISWMTESVSQ